MDSNTTSVETKVSAAVLTPAAPVSAVSTLPRLRTGMAVMPKNVLRVDDQASSWRGIDLGFGHDYRCGFAAGTAAVSTKQHKNNSIEFQIRLGPPCSPPV